MKLEKSKIKRILVISLSNVGDVILTFPVIDVLKRDFPSGALDVVIGPKTKELFEENPHIHKIYVFNKRGSPLEKLFWTFQLRRERFDLVVDLRNTAIPFLLGASYRTSFIARNMGPMHKRLVHLNRLKSIYNFSLEPKEHFCISVGIDDKKYIEGLIQSEIGFGKEFAVISPGAASHEKRWTTQGFADVADYLMRHYGFKIIFVGDSQDEKITEEIIGKMSAPALNLCGKTTLPQLAEVLRCASLVVANDSGVMHMASYLNVPLVAIFGPTSPQLYGPWSTRSFFVENKKDCPVCQGVNSAVPHQCMEKVLPEDVLRGAVTVLTIKENKPQS